MKSRSILLLVVFVLFSVIVSCEKSDDTIYNSEVSNYDKEILALINQHRAKKGLKKLVHNNVVWKYANEHSKNMANRKVKFGHGGFNLRIQKINTEIGGNGSAAENVASGQTTAKSVVATWLNSSGHRKNIEGNYQLTGISAIKSKQGTWFYTQIFITKK